MYSFSYDEDHALLTVMQRGYWSIAIFRDFERDFLTQHAQIRARRNSYRVLADCRDYPVQSAEIGEAFGVLFNTLMAENTAPYAIVIGSMLNKIQARRALPFANIRLFSDLREANDWLFEGSPGTATPPAGNAA